MPKLFNPQLAYRIAQRKNRAWFDDLFSELILDEIRDLNHYDNLRNPKSFREMKFSDFFLFENAMVTICITFEIISHDF